jgi:hypothetical protein
MPNKLNLNRSLPAITVEAGFPTIATGPTLANSTGFV